MTYEEIVVLAERMARQLRAEGKSVTRDLRVDADVAAEILGRSWQTLKRWRLGDEKEGPRYFTIGNRPTYRITELLQWIELGASQGCGLKAAHCGSRKNAGQAED